MSQPRYTRVVRLSLSSMFRRYSTTWQDHVFFSAESRFKLRKTWPTARSPHGDNKTSERQEGAATKVVNLWPSPRAGHRVPQRRFKPDADSMRTVSPAYLVRNSFPRVRVGEGISSTRRPTAACQKTWCGGPRRVLLGSPLYSIYQQRSSRKTKLQPCSVRGALTRVGEECGSSAGVRSGAARRGVVGLGQIGVDSQER